jgi:hypothetical protein
MAPGDTTSIRLDEEDRALLAAVQEKTGITSVTAIVRHVLRAYADQHRIPYGPHTIAHPWEVVVSQLRKGQYALAGRDWAEITHQDDYILRGKSPPEKFPHGMRAAERMVQAARLTAAERGSALEHLLGYAQSRWSELPRR